MTATAKNEPTAPSLRRLASLIADYHQPFQSNFQTDHFVLAQEGVTWWGAFRQCLREVAVRVEAMRMEYVELNEAMAEAAGKKNVADRASENPKNATRAIKDANAKYAASKALLKKANLDMRMRDRERDMAHLVNRLFALWDRVVEEYGEDFDPRTLDEITWARKLHRRALAEKLCHGQVSAGVLESILALPETHMTVILAECGRMQGEQCLDALTKMTLPDVANLPTPRMIAAESVRPLLGGDEINVIEQETEGD